MFRQEWLQVTSNKNHDIHTDIHEELFRETHVHSMEIFDIAQSQSVEFFCLMCNTFILNFKVWFHRQRRTAEATHQHNLRANKRDA
jgi:hypothetical protein